jgi:hypothetical protein
LDWKDTLLPGASRVSKPADGVLDPGWVLDTYGTPQERNDWVMGPNGPAISGSGEADFNNPANFSNGVPRGQAVPSPGFLPVDAGQYGSNPWFAGRGGAAPSLTGAAVAPTGALGTYGKTSAAELQALLKLLGQVDLGSLVGAAGGGGLRIPE